MRSVSFSSVLLRGLLAACVLCVATGCPTSIQVSQKAEVKVRGKVLIIPFSYASRYYYDSPEGNAVASEAMGALLRNARDISLVESSSVRGAIRSALIRPEEADTREPDWREVGRAAGADYLIHGRIESLSWQDPQDPNLPRCVFTVTYSVFSVAKNGPIFSVTRSGRYPWQLLGDKGVTVYEMGPQGLRERGLRYIGQVVARTLYEYRGSTVEDETITSVVHGPAGAR